MRNIKRAFAEAVGVQGEAELRQKGQQRWGLGGFEELPHQGPCLSGIPVDLQSWT